MSAVVYLSAIRPEPKPVEPRKAMAEIRQFTQRIALCGVCGSARHRAASCPLRPRTETATGA